MSVLLEMGGQVVSSVRTHPRDQREPAGDSVAIAGTDSKLLYSLGNVLELPSVLHLLGGWSSTAPPRT
jgi:hypothetical protein